MIDIPSTVERSALRVFIVAAEVSGDLLGGRLMTALTTLHPGEVTFRGVGGQSMEAAGLASLFPMEDVTSMGIIPVIAKLPIILRRLRDVIDAVVSDPPDVLILIDAPDFTHRIADRVRRVLPNLPVVKYVSPTVWAWRPGRAQAMRRSFDLVLALFPFEPEVHRQLGGPKCIYVGHPLLEDLRALRPSPLETDARMADPPVILALPGSRRREIRALMGVFGEALGRVGANYGPIDLVLPTPAHLADEVSKAADTWPVRPRIVTSGEEKAAAFRRARAALAASGTVTLELALSGVPHVAAYRVSLAEGLLMRALVRVHPVIRNRTVVLANLIFGENIVPEFLQTRCTSSNLAGALTPILRQGDARRRQTEAFGQFDAILRCGEGSPGKRAAQAVLDLVGR